MNLDVAIIAVKPVEVFSANITHNLAEMAKEAGIYMHLWRPEEIGIKTAGELIGPLTEGLVRLNKEPERFRKFNPTNGWGNYEALRSFVADYLRACLADPNGELSVSR